MPSFTAISTTLAVLTFSYLYISCTHGYIPVFSKSHCSSCRVPFQKFHLRRKKNKNPILFLAIKRPERDEESRLSQRWEIEKVIFNVTKSIGAKTLSSNLKNEVSVTSKKRDIFFDKVNVRDQGITPENFDSLDLPSDSLVIMDRNVRDISQALLNSRPDLPTEYFEAPMVAMSRDFPHKDNNTILYLEEQLNQIKQQRHHNMDKESSFKAVFENESGFLNQSEAFRMYLAPKNISEDPSNIIHKAIVTRRGEEFRRRQSEAIEKIQKTMMETVNVSISQSSNLPLSETCCMCGCRLSKEEIAQAKLGGHGRSKQGICRECFVEEKAFTNGSPYLIGRVTDTPPTPNTNEWKGLVSNPPTTTNDEILQSVQPEQWRKLYTSLNKNQQSVSSSSSSSSTSSSVTNPPPPPSPYSSSAISKRLQTESANAITPETNGLLNSQQQIFAENTFKSIPSSSIMDKVNMLQNELEIYKRRAETAETELVILRNVIRDLETKVLQNQQENFIFRDPDEDPPIVLDEDEYWVSLNDPETGETFRWNKYTGETEW